MASGAARLADAANPALAPESRFDLAYNAAHALALAALRYRGYRSDSRYVVFQALPHTLGVPAATWRVLAKGHERRNLAEYEGALDVDERLLTDIPECGREGACRGPGVATAEVEVRCHETMQYRVGRRVTSLGSRTTTPP